MPNMIKFSTVYVEHMAGLGLPRGRFVNPEFGEYLYGFSRGWTSAAATVAGHTDAEEGAETKLAGLSVPGPQHFSAPLSHSLCANLPAHSRTAHPDRGSRASMASGVACAGGSGQSATVSAIPTHRACCGQDAGQCARQGANHHRHPRSQGQRLLRRRPLVWRVSVPGH